jgi:hypothetical protein
VRSQPFDTRIRWALVGLGILALAIGTAAVFKTESGTGATALVAGGMLVLLVAAVGDRITRLRYGDAEVVFELVEKAAQAEASGDPETANVLIETALRRASGAPQPDALAEATRYERQVLQGLLRAVPQGEVRLTEGELVDAVLLVDDLRIGVVITTLRSGRQLERTVVRLAQDSEQMKDLAGLLVVSRADPDSPSIAWAREQIPPLIDLPIEVVAWRFAEGEQALADPVSRLVAAIMAKASNDA